LALGLLLAALPFAATAETLNIYAWSGEIPQEVIDDFTARTGIDVTLDTFDSNETLMAKIGGGVSGYDLVGPSQYAVQILGKQGHLTELDHSRVTNLGNLGAAFKDVSYDPGLKYSIPFLWGTTGLAYNADCVEEPVTSWKSLWDPKYTGRLYMVDNMLAAYIAALQVNGFDAGTTDPDEIEIATQSLLEQKPRLAGYNSTNFGDFVASGEACIVQAFNYLIADAIKANPSVKYILPEEGGTMWIDGFAIPKSAEDVDAAYAFINYMLEPEVAAKTSELSNTSTVVDAAIALLPPELGENGAMYPSAETLANVDFILDVGEATKYYQDGWTRVKTAQ
jgi:spermidine/putrescine transport system substrate-binding protein